METTGDIITILVERTDLETGIYHRAEIKTSWDIIAACPLNEGRILADTVRVIRAELDAKQKLVEAHGSPAKTLG